MTFFPSTGPIPSGLQTETLLLRPLRAADNELDYAAVMASQVYLRLCTDGAWPHEGFTLAENLADLQRHEMDHERRTSFTFTVLNPTQTECLGCVYINPLDRLLMEYAPPGPSSRAFPPGSAHVYFWLRPQCQAEEQDRHLLSHLLAWFGREWAFPQVVFTANQRETHQRALYEQAGLHQLLTLVTPNHMTLYG